MDNARQQIVDSIVNSSNILVTVSTNPSVDELSAALGLTIILNNQDKRATAIFSGATPPAINFLEPDKTFADSADSLRDFIIALDKEKADHLRYKVDGDVVKIFITPYKTTLSQADLDFSQGDYNVDLVLALGVRDQAHLDKALEAHGKILHDATVATITAGKDASSLGSLDWHDGTSSSLSEMIVGLADALKGDGPVFDEQIATALLTGIVSATARFSNDHTTSRAMTMAAQLMAAGANQQLIAAKLAEAHDIGPTSIAKSGSSKGDESGNELVIERSGDESTLPKPSEPPVELVKSKEESDQQELETQLAGLTTPATGSLEDIEKELQKATDEVKDEKPEAGDISDPNAATVTLLTPIPVEQPPVVAPPVLAVPPVPAMPVVETPPPAPVVELPPAPEVEAPVDPLAPILPPLDATPPPQIVNDHPGTDFSMPPVDTAPAINSIQNNPNDGEPPTVDPFNAPLNAQEIAPVLPGSSMGTPEGAALLGAMPDALLPPTDLSAAAPVVAPVAPVAPVMPTVEIPQLPPLPPIPTDTSLPPLPPPPPPPPVLGQPPSGSPSGAVSGDVFGDGTGTGQPPVAPPEPGQFKIPGS